MVEMNIEKISLDIMDEIIKDCYTMGKRFINYDNVYKTNKAMVIYEDVKLNRIYVEYDFFSNDQFVGLTTEDIIFLAEYFNIDTPHVFNYPSDYENSILCIGNLLEGEEAY